MVAARIATLASGEAGRGRLATAIAVPTQPEAAQLLNVSVDSIQRARVIQAQGAPALVSAVEQRRVSVSAAAEVASLPKGEQVQTVAQGEREIIEKARASPRPRPTMPRLWAASRGPACALPPRLSRP